MSGERDKQAAPEATYGPEPRVRWGEPAPAPKLGPVPEHFDFGSVPVNSERTLLVAAPFLLNRGSGEMHTSIEPRVTTKSTPSAFRDQLGLDPDPVLAAASAEVFDLVSPSTSPVNEYGAPPPLRLRFKPSRPGQVEVVVRISVVGADGTTDTKTIRVTGSGAEVPPKIVDTIQAPDLDKTLDGLLVSKPVKPL
ncbi:MAG TPA: hypothetical protein VK427_09425, partial [Kofleriaceae bacterium]|nr:hypothetical protein [Kofleriaceae bacterium]